MSKINPARDLMMGITVASILAMGLVFWFGEDAIDVQSQLENDAPNLTELGTLGEWGIVSANFGSEVGNEEHAGGASNGWGHFTIEELYLQEGVVKLAEMRLAVHELAFAADLRIRDLADASGYKPSEVVDILCGRDPGEGCDELDCDHDSGSGSGRDNHECDDESCDGKQSAEHGNND